MKWFGIVLFLYSAAIFAQTTTGCCPLERDPVKIIKKDMIANSCLLCKKIPVRTFYSYHDEFVLQDSSNDLGKFDKFVKKFDSCSLSQKLLIQEIMNLIDHTIAKYPKQKVHSLDDVLSTYAKVADDIFKKKINKTLHDLIEDKGNSPFIKDCKFCDKEKDKEVSKNIENLNKLKPFLESLKLQYSSMAVTCKDFEYQVEPEETKQLEQIKRLLESGEK